MAKQPSEKYYPGNIPDTLPALVQFLFDELWRISRALNEFPVALNVSEIEIGVPVTTTPTEFRLFEGETPILDIPGGSWDIALGEWTAPVTGLYQINVNTVTTGPGAGNKIWGVVVRLYVNDIQRWENTDVGDDAFKLSCALSVSGRLLREDVVRLTITLEHEQFVGSTDVESHLSLINVAQE
jgi:hypothetical protein